MTLTWRQLSGLTAVCSIMQDLAVTAVEKWKYAFKMRFAQHLISPFRKQAGDIQLFLHLENTYMYN